MGVEKGTQRTHTERLSRKEVKEIQPKYYLKLLPEESESVLVECISEIKVLEQGMSPENDKNKADNGRRMGNEPCIQVKKQF